MPRSSRPPADPAAGAGGAADPAATTNAGAADRTAWEPVAPFPPPREPPHRARVDVAVVGGHYGGSLVACCLRACGRTVAVLDAGSHPRFSLSEGWTPAAGRRLRELAERFRLSVAAAAHPVR